MIVVRNIFRARFGKAKEVTELLKQGLAISQRAGFEKGKTRLLTDVAGEAFYTFVLETTHDSLSQWEQASHAVRSNAEWRAWYQQLTPHIESGERTIYSVIE